MVPPYNVPLHTKKIKIGLSKPKSIYRSLGQLRRVQWMQPAYLPTDWSPAACWWVVPQTADRMQAEDLTNSLLLEHMAETQVAYTVDRRGEGGKNDKRKWLIYMLVLSTTVFSLPPNQHISSFPWLVGVLKQRKN